MSEQLSKDVLHRVSVPLALVTPIIKGPRYFLIIQAAQVSGPRLLHLLDSCGQIRKVNCSRKEFARPFLRRPKAEKPEPACRHDVRHEVHGLLKKGVGAEMA